MPFDQPRRGTFLTSDQPLRDPSETAVESAQARPCITPRKGIYLTSTPRVTSLVRPVVAADGQTYFIQKSALIVELARRLELVRNQLATITQTKKQERGQG
jgi:hypothetical protein